MIWSKFYIKKIVVRKYVTFVTKDKIKSNLESRPIEELKLKKKLGQYHIEQTSDSILTHQ